MRHSLRQFLPSAAALAAALCASAIAAQAPAAPGASTPGADAAPARVQAPAPQDAAGASGRIEPWHPRFDRSRPVVAVVGQNAGTELIDYVVPYGVLAESGAAEVFALATEPGALRLRPALRILPAATVAGFDERFPQGADYVIVPAVNEDRVADPVLLDWLRAQAAKGATLVSICDGALVVANAGLLRGHRATGHWATQALREREHPDTRWIRNVRYVADGNVVSSAGVTAAIPTALALVEAIAGTEVAAGTAARLGVADWGAAHDSEQFHIGAGTVLTYAGNRWFSSDDRVAVQLVDGIDDIALAFAVDTYARTLRSPVVVEAASPEPVRTRHALVLLPPDVVQGEPASARPARRIALTGEAPAMRALDLALADIGRAYGAATESFVALQIEYPPAYVGR